MVACKLEKNVVVEFNSIALVRCVAILGREFSCKNGFGGWNNRRNSLVNWHAIIVGFLSSGIFETKTYLGEFKSVEVFGDIASYRNSDDRSRKDVLEYTISDSYKLVL